MSRVLQSLLLCLCLWLPIQFHHGLLPAPAKILDIEQRDLHCLALNIYHESRGESLAGQAAVALVTLNRVHSPHWPRTVCGVVYQPRQFSWTLQRHKPVHDPRAWQTAVAVARAAVEGRFQHFSATHFHTHQVRPHWRKKLEVVTTIGNHIFYH